VNSRRHCRSAARLLTSITGGTTENYNYDPFGRLDTVTAAGKVIERNTYDGFDRIAEDEQQNSTGALIATKYTYDPLDRTVSKTTDVGGANEKTTDYSYLGLSDQVLDEDVAGKITKSYQYTPWGERLSQVKTNTDGSKEDAYYRYNDHTDVEDITDSSGDTKATYGYTAYGQDDPLCQTAARHGTRGSQQINGLVRDILPWLLERANVIHQCGPGDLAGLRQQTASLPTDLAARYALTDSVGASLPDVLALADVVISRSGADTVAELTALGKVAVLIPLAMTAGNEQIHNARHLHNASAAVALLFDVTPQHLRDALEPLLADPGMRAAMAEESRSLGRPDAADRLVDVLLSVGDRPR
jgi:YD repeat-containing protein